MEREIRTAGADLDVTTLRRSSPYSLVCRKNSVSYDRRVAQRHKELADIRLLKGMEDYHDHLTFRSRDWLARPDSPVAPERLIRTNGQHPKKDSRSETIAR